MSDRSQSSSPDILGPPGDADYLISSPAPPNFSRRRKIATPYSFKTPQTKARPSQSSGKSAHTIRFNDIVLPSSPPFRSASRQRSLSPTKVQSETNVSPWRIRVTVEAEHEDENEEGNSPKKRRKSNPVKTMTTKVPLKDEKDMSQTPKKRRGRPRKSDVTQSRQSESSARGSPGRTPKRTLSSPEKRPRGRPRKSLLVPVDPTESLERAENVAESIETDDVLTDVHHDTPEIDHRNEDTQPMPPLVLGGGESDGAESLGHASDDEQPLNPDDVDLLQSHPEGVSSPKIGKRIIEGDSQLTPIKSRSAARRIRAVSPENTLYAGHTPRPRRTYPTPTSSSQLDDEKIDNSARVSPQKSDHTTSNNRISVADPTSEHREFDSIMESEGFSMVTLDSLPSAKQQGLASILSSAKRALNPFFARTAPQPSSLGSSLSQPQSSRDILNSSTGRDADATDTALETNRDTTAAAITTEPSEDRTSNLGALGPSIQQERGDLTLAKRKRTVTLAKLVRAGIILQSALRNSSGLDDAGSLDGPRNRLAALFSDFNSDVRRELLAGLRFGEQLVKRQIERENSRRLEDQSQNFDTGRHSLTHDSDRFKQNHIHSPSENDQDDGPQPLSGFEQRQREWQREREAVSRRIQQADSAQVVVIESDQEDVGTSLANDASTLADAVALEKDQDEEEYDDIWQLEARDPEPVPSQITREGHEHLSMHEEPKGEVNTGSAKSRAPAQSSDGIEARSPYGWITRRSDHIPPLGKSKLQRLRAEPVNLSPLLRERETPNARRYYADSSPQEKFYPSSPPRTSTKLSTTILTSENNSPSLGVQPQSHTSQLRAQKSVSPPGQTISIAENRNEYSVQSSHKANNEERHSGHQVAMPGITAAGEESEANGHESEVDDVFLAEASKSSTNSTKRRAKSSWIRRLTGSFTPRWWANSEQRTDGEESMDDCPKLSSQNNALKRSRETESRFVTENTRLPKRARNEQSQKTQKHAKALSTSGYFSNDHYIALRRVYRLAKRSPERFPYHPNPRRNDMIGDYLWTADGLHGVAITEIHFGILDQFTREIREMDRRRGGSGKIGWTEDELHKRLFSIIVGEQIRRERKGL